MPRPLPSLLAVLFAVILAGGALAQSLPGRWWQDANSGCEIWNAAPQEDDEVRWSGGCASGRAEGEGLLVWRYRQGETWVADRYEGEMADGKRNGQGKLTTAAGYSYEGSWKDGALNGQGIAVKPNGERYEGEFKDGLPDGTGRVQLANGASYDGGWLAGKKHGKGVCRVGQSEGLPCCWDEDRAIEC